MSLTVPGRQQVLQKVAVNETGTQFGGSAFSVYYVPKGEVCRRGRGSTPPLNLDNFLNCMFAHNYRPNCDPILIKFAKQEWRSKVGAGPCARIPNGPFFPHSCLPVPLDSDGPACTARLAHPIATPLLKMNTNFILYYSFWGLRPPHPLLGRRPWTHQGTAVCQLSWLGPFLGNFGSTYCEPPSVVKSWVRLCLCTIWNSLSAARCQHHRRYL